MAFELATVTAFVAALDVVGRLPDGTAVQVCINDYATLQTRVDSRQRPVLQPDVTQAVTMETHSYASYGSGATAKQVMVYRVPYLFFYAPAGNDRALAVSFPPLVYTLTAIASAIVANTNPPDPIAWVQLAGIVWGQTVVDPSHTEAAPSHHHGAQLALRVTEYIN